jgi:hypothetical protein
MIILIYLFTVAAIWRFTPRSDQHVDESSMSQNSAGIWFRCANILYSMSERLYYLNVPHKVPIERTIKGTSGLELVGDVFLRSHFSTITERF